MRRREVDPPADGWRLDGRWYGSQAEYEQALASRAERRRRIMALIEAERQGLS